LYYTDAGATFRAAMKNGAEPLLPLSEWVISLPQIHKHRILEYWEVSFAMLSKSLIPARRLP
jgi:hypothetical protein